MACQITILDILGLALKDHYACSIKSLSDENGKSVTAWQDGLAVFVERTLLPLVQGRTPLQDVYACWDAGSVYRLERFPDYKKARRAREQSKVEREQIGLLKAKLQRLLAYLGVKNVWAEGVEADDVVALLAERLVANHILVYTNDGDLLSLVSPKVSVMLMGKTPTLHTHAGRAA